MLRKIERDDWARILADKQIVVATQARDTESDNDAGAAGHSRLHQCTRTTDCCAANQARSAGEPLLASNRRAADCRCGGTNRAPIAANRQANRDWCGRRPMAGAALDDCRPVALADARDKVFRPAESGGFRFS